MHSVCELLVSVLFIAVPTNTENFKFFLHLLITSVHAYNVHRSLHSDFLEVA